MTLIAIISLLIILLTAAWNGLIIRWKMTDKGSRLWHWVGGAIRALICLQLYLLFGVYWGIVGLFLSWIPYNIIISLIAWNKWWVLSDKGIDGFLKRLL